MARRISCLGARVSQSAPTPHSSALSLGRTALALSPAVWLLLTGALLAALAAVLLADGVLRLALASAATTLGCLALIVPLLAGRERRVRAGAQGRIADFIAHDASPSFTTDAEGRIGYQNAVAENRFGDCSGQTLSRALGDLFANPAAVLYRLQTRAMSVGSAREDVVTRRGHVRLSVHRVGEGEYLWRLEEMVDRSAGGRGAETLSLPMLTVSKSGTVLFMNEAMRRIVGGRVRALDRIFPYLPLRSGEETEVSGAEGPVRCIVAELEGASGRREIYLLPAAEDLARPAAARPDFEDLPLALARISPDGVIEQANRLARELLGLPARPDGAVPALAELLEGPGRPVNDWLADAMAGLAENRPQVLRVRRRDEDSFLQVTLRRVAEAGRPGLVAVFNDATELKSLEAQIVQSQKMQAIGQLAGGVAHDFNNLLTAISGHCDLMLLRHDRGDPDYADLVQIHQNANRAASLVRQLLAFSRKQTLKPEVFDLRDTLGELTHLLGRLVGEKIALDLDHDPELSAVRADRRQMEQVLMNLVVNARDAMPAGGTIRIETENRTLREELRRDRASVPPGDYVVIRVRDQGVGIPADKREKIFEPFFTTKRAGEGTGLGLSTAYGIVKQTGGFIFVDSTPGEGTVFSVYLPACDHLPESAAPLRPAALAEAGAEPQAPGEPATEGERVILLVEDEAPVRAFASRALRMRGYRVIEAETAEDALETLEDPALRVDLFLTDVVMPGMDGPSWVREALKRRPDAKVVFVSGYAEEAVSTGQTAIPNSVFLPKPFSLSELTATVQRQIH
jgi:two-component system cell cycle sensor histidine kinase/response regulator CckA